MNPLLDKLWDIWERLKRLRLDLYWKAARGRYRRYRWLLGSYAFHLRNRILVNRPVRIRVTKELEFNFLPWGAIVQDAWSSTRFERTELKFVLNYLEPGMTFFDIGANVGLFTLSAAAVPSVQVHAFEPALKTYAVLLENIKLNAASDIVVNRTALGDHAGSAELAINAPGRDGLNTIGRATHSDALVVGYETVPMTTLDSYVQQHRIAHVDLLKVDVEGAELLVFRGARELLNRHDAPVILYESADWTPAGFDYHPVEIMWFLQNCGYRLFTLDKTGRPLPRQPSDGYNGMLVAMKCQP